MFGIVVEAGMAIQVGNTRDTQATAQILEVLAVRHLPELDSIAPAVVPQSAMVKTQLMTRVVDDAVVRQIVGRDSAFAAFSQVTEVRFKLQSATR